MRAMLEDLRKKLGMPHEQDVDDRDYGYRSTLTMRDLESRYDQDVSNEISVPVQRAVSPPRSAGRRSPPYLNSGVGRPPLPRRGRGRNDSTGTGSEEFVETPDSSPQRINVLTIDSEFENNQSSYNAEPANITFVESHDGYDETDGAVPSSTRTAKSSRDRPGSSSSARRRRPRRDKNSLATTPSTERPYASPSPRSLDVDEVPDGVTDHDLPSLDDRSQLGLDKTRTVALPRGLTNGDVGYSGSASYRDVEDEGGVETVDKHNDDDDDADSDEAYDTNDQLLDTLTEYQRKLEKTNFVDEGDDDSTHDELDRTASLPPAHRQTAAESTSPPGLDSPSDSLDVSELEEDEYLEC